MSPQVGLWSEFTCSLAWDFPAEHKTKSAHMSGLEGSGPGRRATSWAPLSFPSHCCSWSGHTFSWVQQPLLPGTSVFSKDLAQRSPNTAQLHPLCPGTQGQYLTRYASAP